MKKSPVNISGISESRVAPVAAYIKKEKGGQGLIIVSSYAKAKRLKTDLSFFYDGSIYVIPEQDEALVRYDAGSRENLFERMKALKALSSGEDCVVIAPVSAVLKKVAPHRTLTERKIKAAVGDTLELLELRERLSAMGYENMTLVDGRGQFSMRGSIVDIFTPDADYPYRIEFFDDEVDSIRSFDIDTQRSIENLKEVTIFPASEIINDRELYAKAAAKIEKEYTEAARRLDRNGTDEARAAAARLSERKNELMEYMSEGISMLLMENYIHYFYDDAEYIWQYLGKDSVIMIDDPDRVHEAMDFRNAEIREDFAVLMEKGYAAPEDFKIHLTRGEYFSIYNQDSVYIFTPFKKQIKGIDEYSQIHSVLSKQTPVFNGRMDIFESELKSYVKHGYEVTVVCSTDERLENLSEFTERIGLDGKIKLVRGELTSGIEFPEHKVCYVRDEDIFGGQKKKKTRKNESSSVGQKLTHFSDLKNGDYVVHENHGIGKFIGIEQLDVQGVKKDYLKIKYAGQDMLYVPVDQMDIVQKYIGDDSGAPKINKLSGSEWKATKAKAKAAIAEMAYELIEISAARQAEPGYAFSKDSVWQSEFEESFQYEETEDQLRCINEIKRDMERPVAMDRLLLGDVGFGKTEVAARAMFKCLADGKQGAVLVPTTLLANQHYYTLKERFERFPFTVEVLSRFRSSKQQDEIIKKLAEGSVDLVIGTHRLLSKDVKFKNLGLLVVDEEQRFGVQHKEALKMLKKNVDVLTLSATPIPRTLHMSLTGIKDMSIIEQPPEERYPVQTYVLEQDYALIKEIIERELSRGGQVYVVFNRVQGINKIAAEIRDIVPDARVAVGHGQMDERELEKVMLAFINGETNVLVATTIIESGIDIPNVNTIIILNADKLGLSQLYQLRGRVGRSSRMAYAYLMYQKDKVLTEVAEKRLRAIKEFTEFGAGFKVAMRDLEIRGAGNILGTAQSGHMMSVGYELYCKLVDDAVRALKGEIVNPDAEEASIELAAAAYISDTYINDEVTKLAMYKRIAGIVTAEEEDELTDELIDRFGDIPQETVNLMKISRIRSAAESIGATRVREETVTVSGKPSKRIVLDFAARNGLKPEALAEAVSLYGKHIFIHGGVKPFVRYVLAGGRKDKLSETLELLETLHYKNENLKVDKM
ncbi:MAG: transcription-repair coupling factor [Eubacteriales Family XIII. Incertae Sedis bacterium]|nr:MAG: transcription-repair coupling factor [Clostridiales Family XIII bacterium]PWM67174.1 MAG: transcription-repair coupling factor [Clostridiales Family XIII bacterium]